MELVVGKNELAATYVCVQFVLEPHVPSGESNPHDSYAVIVVKGKQTVGHMPQKVYIVPLLPLPQKSYFNYCHLNVLVYIYV